MKSTAVVLVIAGLGVAARAQQCEIYPVAPAAVGRDPFTVEVWGLVEGEPFVPGLSAIARFGIDILTAQGAAGVGSISNITIAPWAAGLGVPGHLEGANIIGTSGGQVANLWGFLNPDIDLSDPILLFTFEVTIRRHWVGSVQFLPANPDPNGGLAYYPISTEGASIAAPNDPGTTLTLTGATVFTPNPGPLALFALAGVGGRARRRTRPR